MCHQNQLIGCGLMSFGLGLLVGTVLSSGFLSCIIALGVLVLGFCLIRKR